MGKRNEMFEDYEDNSSKLNKILWGVGITLIVLSVVLSSVVVINQGFVGVKTTFGQADANYLSEGLHFKLPIVQDVIKFDVRTKKSEANANSASRDLQVVSAGVTLNYRILPSDVVSMYSDVGIDYENKLIPQAVQESVKAVTAKYTAEELITKRDEVKARIDDQLKNNLLTRNIIAEQIFITNFDFSTQFNQAIESKVTAEQEALRAENELKKVQIDSQQIIARQQAQADALRIEADANAYKVKTEAEAEAYSLRVVGEELSKQKSLIDYKAVEKWTGEVPRVNGVSPVPFIDLETN